MNIVNGDCSFKLTTNYKMLSHVHWKQVFSWLLKNASSPKNYQLGSSSSIKRTLKKKRIAFICLTEVEEWVWRDCAALCERTTAAQHKPSVWWTDRPGLLTEIHPEHLYVWPYPCTSLTPTCLGQRSQNCRPNIAQNSDLQRSIYQNRVGHSDCRRHAW